MLVIARFKGSRWRTDRPSATVLIYAFDPVLFERTEFFVQQKGLHSMNMRSASSQPARSVVVGQAVMVQPHQNIAVAQGQVVQGDPPRDESNVAWDFGDISYLAGVVGCGIFPSPYLPILTPVVFQFLLSYAFFLQSPGNDYLHLGSEYWKLSSCAVIAVDWRDERARMPDTRAFFCAYLPAVRMTASYGVAESSWSKSSMKGGRVVNSSDAPSFYGWPWYQRISRIPGAFPLFSLMLGKALGAFDVPWLSLTIRRR